MSQDKGERRRTTLRLPPILGAQVKALAEREGISLNEFVCREIEKQVERDEREAT